MADTNTANEAASPLVQLYAEHGEFVPVRSHSPAWLRSLWYRMGRRFEQEYDGRVEVVFKPWAGDTVESECALHEKTHGYVIVEDGGRELGALCVRWLQYEGEAPGWSFDWVWILPTERGKGRLRRTWLMVRATYGDNVMWTAKDPAVEALARNMSRWRPAVSTN